MILCDSELRAALHHGVLKIDPAPKDTCFSTSAVDLTLGGEFRRWKASPGGSRVTVDPSDSSFSYEKVAGNYLEEMPALPDGSILIGPNEFLLGITEERVTLPIPSRLSARVEGRSSLARLGLGIHITAPTIHAGFSGKITLEIANHGSLNIVLKPGLRVCQLIVEQLFGTPNSEMVGIFQNQESVIGRSK